MAKQRTRLYFVSDLHGSDKCFRKFLNGGPIYGADVMVLGGDLAGKAIQSITPAPRGRVEFTFPRASYHLEAGAGLPRTPPPIPPPPPHPHPPPPPPLP